MPLDLGGFLPGLSIGGSGNSQSDYDRAAWLNDIGFTVGPYVPPASQPPSSPPPSDSGGGDSPGAVPPTVPPPTQTGGGSSIPPQTFGPSNVPQRQPRGSGTTSERDELKRLESGFLSSAFGSLSGLRNLFKRGPKRLEGPPGSIKMPNDPQGPVVLPLPVDPVEAISDFLEGEARRQAEREQFYRGIIIMQDKHAGPPQARERLREIEALRRSQAAEARAEEVARRHAIQDQYRTIIPLPRPTRVVVTQPRSSSVVGPPLPASVRVPSVPSATVPVPNPAPAPVPAPSRQALPTPTPTPAPGPLAASTPTRPIDLITQIVAAGLQPRGSSRQQTSFASAGLAAPTPIPLPGPAPALQTQMIRAYTPNELSVCEEMLRKKRKRRRTCTRSEEVWVAGHYRKKCTAGA